jgi:hypothetical protein
MPFLVQVTLKRENYVRKLQIKCVKQTVYCLRIHNIQHLKQRIGEAAASATPEFLGRMWQRMEYRLDVCRATKGAHTEL